MGYPRQASVANRLQDESLDELQAMKAYRWAQIERLWRRTRTELRGHILDIYHTYFPKTRWSLASLRMTGAQMALNQGIRDRVDAFKHQSWMLAKTGVNEVYRQSLLRHAWVLDQTTPPGFKVRIPYRLKLLEAQATFYAGDEATKLFQERWSSYADAYTTALAQNLHLGALNQSDAADAADEVDASTINTPRSVLIDAFHRIFDYNADLGLNEAIGAVANANEAADVVQIWETRRNLTVCDVCADNEGRTEDEVEDWIPAHPNCRCYWRLVPASWAKMLRDGDENDYATAIQMDSAGLVPSAMAIKDDQGRLAGYATVDFGPWLKDHFYAVAGH